MKRSYSVYSEKYGVFGKLVMSPRAVILYFAYKRKDLKFGLSQSLFRQSEEDVLNFTIRMMESYIENLYPKVIYEDKVVETPEKSAILLVFSNKDEYYFHEACLFSAKGRQKFEYDAFRHLGLFQDSFLILAEEPCVDLRYFPHYQYLEFYCKDIPPVYGLFVENIGEEPLYIRDRNGFLIRVNPGERKELKKENTVRDILLPDGDLYPVGI